jgi:Bacterial Ig-like domain/RTX calcium-binding nonapeptide repeat (4 copies)
VTLSGTVFDANGVSNVEVFDGKTDLGPTTISNGAWTFPTVLGEGTHSLYAVATDDAGNTTTTTTQPTIVIDQTPPMPFMSDAIKNSNNSLTALRGMSEANSKVSVYDGSKLLGTVTADSSGDWSLQANINNTIHKFTEASTDVAGNTGSSAGVTVYSPSTNKSLVGGSGNDFLIAGSNDTLTGGAGNDTFVFNANFGKDVVMDFDVNHDSLALSHTFFGNNPIAQLLSEAHDSHAGAVIALDAHDSITLNHVTVAQLATHPSDFHFL